ncbi:NAD(P)-binding domain-containing protein [Nocardia sp. GCM10030253]|uniref:NAD(P)-binding domain-containing protein n=1 Tax=Nocardia sp. GCM10030253 TaxID=3273404 RepID=UPI00363F963A
MDYLRHYAKTLDADIHTGQHVGTVAHDGQFFTARTDTRTTFTAPRLVAATGGFGSPNVPTLPGQVSFTGTVLHASRYRSPDEYAGQRVIVVGAGNSAVQIAVELAEHATVTLVSWTPVKFVPQRPLGRDMHFWFTITGIDSARRMVLDRHRLRCSDDRLTESFRIADRIDASSGLLRRPVARADVEAVVAQLPYLGFHRFLARHITTYALTHPTRPLPMVRW